MTLGKCRKRVKWHDSETVFSKSQKILIVPDAELARMLCVARTHAHVLDPAGVTKPHGSGLRRVSRETEKVLER